MLNDVDINFLAFFLSGFLAFALGLAWYHPKIMGKRLQDLSGASVISPRNSSPLPHVASFFLWILSACFYAFLAHFLNIDSAAGYFCLSCLLWVAFALPPTLMNALHSGSSFEVMAIDASYQLGGYYIFAGVHIVFLQMGTL